MKKHSIFALLAAMVLSIAATGCDDYLDVNTNTDAPDYVDGYLYLAGIEQAYQGMYWDIRALGPLTQMFGTTSYTTFALHRFTTGSDAGGEIWRTVYWLQGMNLENMINQSLEAEDWTLAGIGYAIKAFSWDAMTKYHGELPMQDAFVDGLLSHRYDYQEDVYTQVREWAETAIELLEREDNHVYGTKISSNDFIYSGDKAKWIKFAHAVIVRNLASLTKKKDFNEKYYNELVKHAALAFSSNGDNAAVRVAGGSADAPYSAYNNFWGVYRGNLTRVYYPHEWAVQIMTGRVPKYDANGDWITVPDEATANLRYEIADRQIICDTLNDAGHFDPRPLAKLSTKSGMGKENETDVEKLKDYVFFGGTFTGTSSSFLNNSICDPAGAGDANVPSLFNTPYSTSSITSTNAGTGRWLYRDDAPYILTTYAEVLFDLAEAQFVHGDKAAAFDTWKKAVEADLEFTASYLIKGSVNDGGWHIGDVVNEKEFNQLAKEYLAGPYVGGLSMGDFSLSHIMMQKFVALYPWGAGEAWVDQRKYMYDIKFSGDVPSKGNGWDASRVDQKSDDDATKVFKGFYLYPANVQGRRGEYSVTYNDGSPCFRVRPRYNSEYMWNKPSLDELAPISGLADTYTTSIPWFAYPGDQPKVQTVKSSN